MNVALTVFVASNVGIAAGYGYAAVAVLGLCALTHLEQAVHALDGSLLAEAWGSWHMLVVHALQFPAIWLFAHGVSRHLRAGGR